MPKAEIRKDFPSPVPLRGKLIPPGGIRGEAVRISDLGFRICSGPVSIDVYWIVGAAAALVNLATV